MTAKLILLAFLFAVIVIIDSVAQDNKSRKPNIIVIMTDDVGWGDLGSYGGGDTRGAPTPYLDRLAKEGMVFTSAYGQPSCTPARAAFLTGRLPIRSGLVRVLGPGSPGGLHKDEITIADTLSKAGYKTVQIGKWHVGETPESMPVAHGFDEAYHTLLYASDAYVYKDPKFNPDFPFENKNFLREYKIKGELEGTKATGMKEVAPVGADQLRFMDKKMADTAINYVKKNSKGDRPFFLYFNTTKMHYPTLPHPNFIGKSKVKSKYGDGMVELDSNCGRLIQAVRDAGIADNTLIVWTTDNGAWQDVYPDSGYTPFRGDKGTTFEAGIRVPMIAWWPGHIPAGTKSEELITHMDIFPTVARLVGTKAPTKDKAGKPLIFDGVDQTQLLFDKKPSARKSVIYMEETEFGGIRYGKWKVVWNLRDQWQAAPNIHKIPALFDLWQDPQERYNIFMNPWADKTWVTLPAEVMRKKLFEGFKAYPNRPIQH
jgi:arylsulfatase A-like enzyme